MNNLEKYSDSRSTEKFKSKPKGNLKKKHVKTTKHKKEIE